MKKQLTVALGLAVIATPVFASKARLEALGEDNFGSYYINDNRNQFLNPARINEAKDLVTYEFGASRTGSEVAADSAGAPVAEGGFNKSWNNMVWGLHFGNSTQSAGIARALVGGNDLQERNVWDLFVGGDAGIKWGANLTYEGFKNSTGTAANTNKLSSNSLRARVGVISGDLDAFAQVSLKGDAKNYQGEAVEGKSSYFLGAGYMMNAYKLFVDYLHVGTDYTSDATTAGVEQEWSINRIRIGAARQERLNDKANLFAKLMLTHQKVEDDGGATAGLGNAAGKLTSITLPIVVGLEYDAASWLALRGSVVQNVYGSSEADPDAGSKQSGTIARTAINAGATLKFGELSVDGLVSTDANGDGDNIGADTNAGNGTLRTDALMSRVSMTYRF